MPITTAELRRATKVRSKSTFTRWAASGCIAHPRMVSVPGKKGREARWTDDTLARAARIVELSKRGLPLGYIREELAKEFGPPGSTSDPSDGASNRQAQPRSSARHSKRATPPPVGRFIDVASLEDDETGGGLSRGMTNEDGQVLIARRVSDVLQEFGATIIRRCSAYDLVTGAWAQQAVSMRDPVLTFDGTSISVSEARSLKEALLPGRPVIALRLGPFLEGHRERAHRSGSTETPGRPEE